MMQTPGAAMKCSASTGASAKFENEANLSSLSSSTHPGDSEGARLAVAVGRRRHGQHLRIDRRLLLRSVAGVARVVARGDRVGDTRGGRVADRLVQGLLAAAAALARAAEAEVGDPDAERRRVRRHPIDSADHLGDESLAARVERLDRVHGRPGGHPDHARAVVPRRDHTRHEGAVPVAVREWLAVHAVDSGIRVEIGVGEVDARVEDGNGGGARAVDTAGRRADPGDTGRNVLPGVHRDQAGRPQAPVRRDRRYARISLQPPRLAVRETRREATQRVPVAQPALEPVGAAQPDGRIVHRGRAAGLVGDHIALAEVLLVRPRERSPLRDERQRQCG